MADDKKDHDGNVYHLIEAFLQCSICGFYFDEAEAQPRLLPCLHTYCYSCIKKLSDGKEEIECPKCQSVHCTKNDAISVFPKDNARHGLMDFIKINNSKSHVICQSCEDTNPASYRCKDCSEFLCEECYSFHKKTIKFKSHSLLSLKDYEYSLQNAKDFINYETCQVHGTEKLNKYCTREGCGMPICSVCAVTTHNHPDSEVVNIKDIYEKKKEELQVSSYDLEKNLIQVQNKMKEIDNEINQIQKDSDLTKENVTTAIETSMKLLYDRRSELQNDVDRIINHKTHILRAQKEELKKHKGSLEDGLRFLQQSTLYSNVPAFLQIVPTIAKQLVNLNTSTTASVPVVKADLHFSTQGLGNDFQNYVQTMGKVMTKTPHPSACSVSIHGDVSTGRDLRMSVTLKDYDGKRIQDRFVQVTMQICNSNGDTKTKDCLLVESGSYETTFDVLSSGRHRIVINAAGQPIKTVALERPTKADQNDDVKKTNDVISKDEAKQVNISLMPIRNDTRDSESCCMCGDAATNDDCVKLMCGHAFCKECVDEVFKYGSSCPLCGNAHDTLYGNQPDGTMKVRRFPQTKLPGYEQYGTIEVMYEFPSGIQVQGHPKPGEWYSGITRRGYLPDNDQGRLIAKLLRVAFDRRLVFTIKEFDNTSKCEITWNKIYHKTRTHGGPQRHGYPDKMYLDRILHDLAYKGITEDCLRES